MSKRNNSTHVIGFRGITEKSGASTLTYTLVDVLLKYGYNAIGIELDQTNFRLLGKDHLFSIGSHELGEFLLKNKDVEYAIVDLNKKDSDFIDDEFYLLSLGKIELEKFKKYDDLSKYKNKRVILNKNIMTKQEVEKVEIQNEYQFEFEIPYFNEYNIADITKALYPLFENIGIMEKEKFGFFKRR